MEISETPEPPPGSAAQRRPEPSEELLGELLKLKTDIGYRFVGFYTACATAYLAMVGLAARYFVELPPAALDALRPDAVPFFRKSVGWFGLSVSIVSLAAPVGLWFVTRQIQHEVEDYRRRLHLPAEEQFLIVKIGAALSGLLFLIITAVWAVLLRIAFPPHVR